MATSTVIGGKKFLMIAIYGPNKTCREFYRMLGQILRVAGPDFENRVIIGGDWNTTCDRRNVTENIDVPIPNGCLT